MPLFRFEIFQADSAPCLQFVAGLLDSAQKSRIVFEPIIEPVLLRFEINQDPGRLAVTCDNDLLRLGLAKIPRQIVLDLRNGTSFTPALRIVRAMSRPPV